MESNVKCTRIILYATSSMYALLGLAVCSAGAWLLVEVTTLTGLKHDPGLLERPYEWLEIAPCLFMIIGAAAILVSFLGCCSVSGTDESKCSLYSYVALLGVLVVSQIAVASAVLVKANDHSTDKFVKDTVNDIFNQVHDNYYVAENFRDIEVRFICCGASGHINYRTKWGLQQLPPSCCSETNGVAVCDNEVPEVAERPGCAEKIALKARYACRYTAYAVLALICLELVALTVAFFLICFTRNRIKVPTETDS